MVVIPALGLQSTVIILFPWQRFKGGLTVLSPIFGFIEKS